MAILRQTRCKDFDLRRTDLIRSLMRALVDLADLSSDTQASVMPISQGPSRRDRRGSRTEKAEPLPTGEVTPISPPCISTIGPQSGRLGLISHYALAFDREQTIVAKLSSESQCD